MVPPTTTSGVLDMLPRLLWSAMKDLPSNPARIIPDPIASAVPRRPRPRGDARNTGAPRPRSMPVPGEENPHGRQTSVSGAGTRLRRDAGALRRAPAEPGARAQHLEADGAPRAVAVRIPGVVSETGRGPARPEAAPARLREGVAAQPLLVLHDPQHQ